MRLPPYPEYKPSGVDWLGAVPEHWVTKRISLLARPGRKTFTDGDWVELPYITSDGIRLLQTGNVGIGSFREQGFRYIDESSFDELRCAEVDPGDVLICRLADPVGRACLAPHLGGRMITSVDVCILKPAVFMDRRYIVYFFSSKVYLDFVESLCRGGTRDRISRSMLGAIRALVPPVGDQSAIADFLDRETAKIDTLVAKKRTLIERLKEKRTALISRTVTRGLPPDAARAAWLDPHPKLKPSGIEWLGDVPEHWEVKPLKRAVRFLEGPGIMAADFVDEGVPLLRISSIGGPKVTLEGCNYLLEERVAERWAHFRVRPGDLLISGSASTGFCSEVDDIAAGAIPYTGIIIIRPFASVTAKTFVRWYFLSESFLVQAALARSGSTIQHFGPSHLARMTMTLPPLPEQLAIAKYLDRETSVLDAMVSKVEAAIERLQEYRTALITAAVTGKIDVSVIRAPEEEVA